MRIYYSTDVVSLQNVSATYCGHLQGGFFEVLITKSIKSIYKYKIVSFKYTV